MLKLLIWENIASPHQSFFFKALAEHPNIDLKVRYFEKFHTERKAMGWQDNLLLPNIEKYVSSNVDEALDSIDDWQQRIHIIPGNSYSFTKKLIDLFISKKIKWIHWSERGGIVLAKKTNFNIRLFDILYPLYAKATKHTYAKKINKYALGALGQGKLAIKDFHRWGIKKEKTATLYYTIGKIVANEKPSDLPAASGIKFIYAGSLTRRKGVEYLIEAFSYISRDVDSLVIIGCGEREDILAKLASKLKIENRVHFLGAKDITDVPNYIFYSDVFVLPTLFDGWGAVLNEAAALGKPIISTNQCGSAYHIIDNENNGFMVNAGNAKALAEAMEKYIKHPDLIKIHSKKSKERYEQFFTPQKNVERLLKQLEKWGVKT